MESVAWSTDGSHLFATASSETSTVLLVIDLRGNLQVMTDEPIGGAWPYRLVTSPDGRYLAYMKRTFESNVMMLERF